jgi:hypothetical protein
MVGDLMMQFKEPTAMAHDKLIYWAFDKDGRIPEDLFIRPGGVAARRSWLPLNFPAVCRSFRDPSWRMMKKKKQ